jgi:diguanylate cyclase (GGDEF)-like protein
VLFVDLDRFKDVNDTLGHEAGDRLLVALAERLRRALRPSDTVARLSGDEFVVVCEDVDNGPAVTEIADRLLAAVERPFRIDGVDARISASIGVSSVREAGADADRLLREADAAMYSVKEARSRRRRPAPVANRTPRLTGADLRSAFQDGELAVAYQPQVSLVDGRLDAVEALVRWRHPRLGPLPAATVLASAEAGGRALDLGAAVLAAALGEAAGWAATARAAGRRPPPVAVNLSLAELGAGDLVPTVSAALEAAGTEADLLRVEVAEGALVEEPAVVLRALRSLQELGVGTTLDDVGRGLPALEAMGELPVDDLKIDRPWVWAASRPWAPGHGILRSAARLARRLGARAVAEGVEAEDELAAATEAGYDAATGHWFAPAQDAEVVAQLVRADLRWSTS